MNIRQLAKEQEDYVIKCRHYLHAHPELGEHEVETTRYIREQLEVMGIPVQTFEGITGLYRHHRRRPAGKNSDAQSRHRRAADTGKSGQELLQCQSRSDACLRT